MLLWGGFGTLDTMALLHTACESADDSDLGIAVRLCQLSIEMRPLFNRSSLWVYPIYAGIGSSVGYWLLGVEQRQVKFLTERREALLEKRRRRALREGGQVEGQGNEGGIVDSVQTLMAAEGVQETKGADSVANGPASATKFEEARASQAV